MRVRVGGGKEGDGPSARDRLAGSVVTGFLMGYNMKDTRVYCVFFSHLSTEDSLVRIKKA
jgi:hypothetical protein